MGNIRPLAALLSKDYRTFIDAAAAYRFGRQGFSLTTVCWFSRKTCSLLRWRRSGMLWSPWIVQDIGMRLAFFWVITIVLMEMSFCLKGFHYLGPYWSKEHEMSKETISKYIKNCYFNYVPLPGRTFHLSANTGVVLRLNHSTAFTTHHLTLFSPATL